LVDECDAAVVCSRCDCGLQHFCARADSYLVAEFPFCEFSEDCEEPAFEAEVGDIFEGWSSLGGGGECVVACLVEFECDKIRRF